MLLGTRPFNGATVAELFSSILRDPPAPLPPSTSHALREILHKCLAKDPAQRYQRAADVRLMLEAVASGLRRRHAPSDPHVAPGAPLPPSPLLSLDIGRDRLCRTRARARADGAGVDTGDQRPAPIDPDRRRAGNWQDPPRFGVRARVETAATVLAGRCDEEALVPYQPFVEALSWYARVCPERDMRAQLAAIGGGAELGPLIPELLRRVPDLPTQPAMNPEGQRYRLFEAVADLFAQASGVRPVLVVFDTCTGQTNQRCSCDTSCASNAASFCIVGTYRESDYAHTSGRNAGGPRREPAVAGQRSADSKKPGQGIDRHVRRK